jgi:hypothetical protein
LSRPWEAGSLLTTVVHVVAAAGVAAMGGDKGSAGENTRAERSAVAAGTTLGTMLVEGSAMLAACAELDGVLATSV